MCTTKMDYFINTYNFYFLAETAKPSKESGKGRSFPQAKIEEAKESQRAAFIRPAQLREYCQKLFQFNAVPYKRFK